MPFVRAMLVLLATGGLALFAQTGDTEGCKDHPLFSRMPGFVLSECKQSQFDLKRFPTGPASTEGGEAKSRSWKERSSFCATS